MATPKVVQRQIAEAAAFEKAILDSQGQPPVAEVVTDAAQLLAEPPKASAPPVQPPAPQAPAPAPSQPTTDWEQRFKTVQGMYDAEVPRMRAQNKTMESELVALKEQVRVLTAAANKPAEKPATPDPKDIESFGADMIDMVNRQATRVFSDLRAEFETRIKSLEDAINGVSKKAESSLEAQFYATLRGLVPNWEEINSDQRWLAWLGEMDPLFGVPRQAALDRAFSVGDAGRVASMFKAFEQTLPRQESLANQVAPTSSGAPDVPVSTQAPAPKMISSKFVDKFFRDVAQHKYRGREQEAAQIEAEINRAAAEGRIV